VAHSLKCEVWKYSAIKYRQVDFNNIDIPVNVDVVIVDVEHDVLVVVVVIVSIVVCSVVSFFLVKTSINVIATAAAIKIETIMPTIRRLSMLRGGTTRLK
jgi:hypothetical protein